MTSLSQVVIKFDIINELNLNHPQKYLQIEQRSFVNLYHKMHHVTGLETFAGSTDPLKAHLHDTICRR